jgi:hypothetical protein
VRFRVQSSGLKAANHFILKMDAFSAFTDIGGDLNAFLFIAIVKKEKNRFPN